MGKFTYEMGLEIQKEVAQTMQGKISRRDLAKLIMRKTGTMQPWWIKSHLQSLTSSGLFKLNLDRDFEVDQDD